MHRFIPVVARSIPIGQARLQVGSIVEVVCLIHMYVQEEEDECRDARRNDERITYENIVFKLSVIINNDEFRSLFFRISIESKIRNAISSILNVKRISYVRKFGRREEGWYFEYRGGARRMARVLHFT